MNLDDLNSLLIRIPDELDAGDRSRLYRAATRRELHRLVPGSYVRATDLASLDGDARYRLTVIAAAARLHPDDVFSHWSAAALWELPIIGRWPDRVHVSAEPTAARRSTTVLRRHRRALVDDAQQFGRSVLTSPAETVIDMARVAPFAIAVAMGDAALRRHASSGRSNTAGAASREDCIRVLEQAPERRGRARARRVVQFIDAAADRPGESLSRVTMANMGVPSPVLQHAIVSVTGRVYYLDFYWPDQNIGGDVDGRVKYLDPAYRGGRTAEQVVYDEKVREDEVRLELSGYGRWGWEVAGSRQLLAERLLRAGLRW